MIQNILTPIDGSGHARMALDMSIDLAARYDARMTLLHVSDHDGNVPEELYDAASRELEEVESGGGETGLQPHHSRRFRVLEHMGRELLRKAQEQAEAKGVRHAETVLDHGDAGKRILHHARNKSADLIIMGSRGFGELTGLVLGSVSHKVFHLAPCSCVTVHCGDKQTSLDGFKSLLVPTDGSEPADKAVELAKYIEKVCTTEGQDYEIELSVDETEQPTTLAEHYIVAHRCLDQGMKLVSLAPRFLGDFEKGVDFKGDLDALEASLHDHAAIAELLGPYKISLHSGSDKLSMYPALARATKGRYHVKTAGTSYLEALRVVARHDEALFRTIINFGRERYETDKATYHVSATLDSAPPADESVSLEELEREYLEIWDEVPAGKGFTKPGRQILHCTFGSTLTHPEYGPAVRSVLETHPDTYTEILKVHFVKHLEALRAGMAE